MLKIALRVKSAPCHQRIGDADGCRISELNTDVVLIILIQERTCNDAADVMTVLFPVFTSKLKGEILDLCLKIRSFCSTVLLQSSGNRIIVLGRILPKTYFSGIGACAGVCYIEDIADTRIVSVGVQKRDAFGATAHITAPLPVPEIKIGTGCCIRSLCMNHDLLMIGVFVQARGCRQERLPALQTAGQLPLRFLRHTPVFLQFTCHKSRLLSWPFIRAKEKKHLFRCFSYNKFCLKYHAFFETKHSSFVLATPRSGAFAQPIGMEALRVKIRIKLQLVEILITHLHKLFQNRFS